MKHKTITTCVYDIEDVQLPILVYVKLLKIIGWEDVYGYECDRSAGELYGQQSSY